MVSLLNIAVLRVSAAIANLRARDEERGQTLVEYGLLSGLLGVAIVLGFTLLPGAITVMTDAIATCISFSGECP